MKNIVMALFFYAMCGCQNDNNDVQTVAIFKGQQITGVTLSEKGRIFANFPRWRKGVKHSVVEVFENGQVVAFPDEQWNSWEIGAPTSDSLFIAIQSVIAFENELYVLDTRNPLFEGVIENPRIFVFDLNSKKLVKTYVLKSASFHNDSYINDLRIDKKNGQIYLTDSGHSGIVVIDIQSGNSYRYLDNHPSTLAEKNELNFSNGVWKNTVHADGIALDTKNDMLYFHALTGYNLYAISTKVLLTKDAKQIEKNVKLIAKTTAPDGMIIDSSGNLFLADLENNKIMKYNISSGKMSVVVEGEKVKWADTFSIYNNELYYTNSRIHEAQGDISKMEFGINKLKIH